MFPIQITSLTTLRLVEIARRVVRTARWGEMPECAPAVAIFGYGELVNVVHLGLLACGLVNPVYQHVEYGENLQKGPSLGNPQKST